MKAKKYIYSFIAVLATLFLFPQTATATESRLAGTWYMRGFSTQKNGRPDNFGYDTGVFTFQSDGSFTGTMTSNSGSNWGETGTSVAAEDGTVYVLFSNGNTVWNNAVNASRDVMAGNSQDASAFYLQVLVRQGDFYSTSDLEGTWYWRSLGIPQNGQPDNFGYDMGTFIFQNDGSFTGTMTNQNGTSWDQSGTASVDANGLVTMDFNDEGIYTGLASPSLNARKNIMAGNWHDSNELYLDILVKKGNSYSISDLEGIWFYRSLGTQMDGQPDNFGYDTAVVSFQTDGAFTLIVTGTTSSEGGGRLIYDTGTTSIDPNGVVTLSFDSEPMTLNPVLSAGKDVMINNYLDPGNEVGLEIFVKKGSLPGDLNGDGIVNLLDLAILTQHWLESTQ